MDHTHGTDTRLTDMPASQPTHQLTHQPAKQRLITLDALRGFALLGILVPNMFAFAWPMAAMTDPTVIGPGAWNRFAHDLTSTVFFGKFMFNFALMFGAGVVLFDRKTAPRDGRPARLSDGAWLWHRRCLVLLILGLIHAYFFWYGDILTWYAIAGLTLLWWVRKLPAQVLLWGGLGLYFLGAMLLAALTVFGVWAISSGEVEGSEMMGAPPADEIAAYLGTWWDAFRFRFFQTLMIQVVFGFIYIPALWGIMAMGMGLTKMGILTGERSLRFHATLGIVLVTVGGLMTFGGYVAAGEITDYRGFLWQGFAQLIGIPLAIGYSQIIVTLARLPLFAGPTKALANVGRMALTNYLMHTLICTTLMYGYGFGRFGSVQYPALFGIIIALWIANFAFSALWLRFFAYGPMEWLWRQGTYLGLGGDKPRD
jgi:uncharacterized protein